jgi:hypothetical protein
VVEELLMNMRNSWPIRRRIPWIMAVTVCGALAISGTALGVPPWSSLIPFKHVEADPQQSYALTEQNGPWLILAATFAGEGAERQSHDLVLELRKRFKLPAYLHRSHYDYSKPVTGLGLSRYGTPKRMKHQYAAEFDQVAVLVGNFNSINDPDAQKTLEKLKYLHPQCLEVSPNKSTSQRMAVWRELQKMVSLDPDVKSKGPMRSAFVSRNPLLPDEYFAPGGLDKFVIDMNKNVQYSLLDCPGKYTVRVATFGGKITMNVDEIENLERPANFLKPWTWGGPDEESPLAKAADNAHRLTVALRENGVEAYEFHDRHESIVTVGEFESVGQPRLDGKTEINPGIHQIMKTYGGQRQDLPGLGSTGLKPYTLPGIPIPFDIQPMPVLVPRRSIAADYAGNQRILE